MRQEPLREDAGGLFIVSSKREQWSQSVHHLEVFADKDGAGVEGTCNKNLEYKKGKIQHHPLIERGSNTHKFSHGQYLISCALYISSKAHLDIFPTKARPLENRSNLVTTQARKKKNNDGIFFPNRRETPHIELPEILTSKTLSSSSWTYYPFRRHLPLHFHPVYYHHAHPPCRCRRRQVILMLKTKTPS